MRLERDDRDGHLILRFDFPADKVYAEQVTDLAKGSYTTWIHFPSDSDADQVQHLINAELIETGLLKITRMPHE